MEPVKSFGKELSLMKNTNLGAYFDRYAETCSIIIQTQQCIHECGIKSNPFELDVMVTHCSLETRYKINALMPCFKDNGEKIFDFCTNNCGNYENLNDFIHEMTKEMKTANDKEKMEKIMFGTNHACGIYKCMTKCNIKQTQYYCGIQQALLLENIFKNIVVAQRSDLEKLNIVETMAKSLPQQCDYMYSPDALFPPQIQQSPNIPFRRFQQNPYSPVFYHQFSGEQSEIPLTQLSSIPLGKFQENPNAPVVHVVYHPLPGYSQTQPQHNPEIQQIRSDAPVSIEEHSERPEVHPTADIQSQEPVVPEPTPETSEAPSVEKSEIQSEPTTPATEPAPVVPETAPFASELHNIPLPQNHPQMPNLEQILAQAQLSMIAKQLQVLDKQERILDKENHKLDFEIFEQKKTSFKY